MAKDTDVSGGVYQSVANITVEAAEDFDDANDAGVTMSFWVNQIGGETPNIEMQLSGETLKIDHIDELTGAHGVEYAANILMSAAEKINLRDSAIGLYSQADTFLDVYADGGIRVGDSSAGAPTNYTKFASDGSVAQFGTARIDWAKITARRRTGSDGSAIRILPCQ